MDEPIVAPLTDEGTRRAALRTARPYRITALAISIASLIPPLFNIRAWLLVVPINLVSLAVNHVGRRHARSVTGIDPGGGRSSDVAKGAAVVGASVGVGLILAAIVTTLIALAALAALAFFVSMLDDCVQHSGGSSSFGLEK